MIIICLLGHIPQDRFAESESDVMLRHTPHGGFPVNRTARALTAVSFGLAFTAMGAGVGHAAVAPQSPTARITQCNADPGFDASKDPVHCHYTHKLPDPKDLRGPHQD